MHAWWCMMQLSGCCSFCGVCIFVPSFDAEASGVARSCMLMMVEASPVSSPRVWELRLLKASGAKRKLLVDKGGCLQYKVQLPAMATSKGLGKLAPEIHNQQIFPVSQLSLHEVG